MAATGLELVRGGAPADVGKCRPIEVEAQRIVRLGERAGMRVQNEGRERLPRVAIRKLRDFFVGRERLLPAAFPMMLLSIDRRLG